MAEPKEYDVLVISDFRLPGGTNRSTAQELEIHRREGIRTGLIQLNSRLIGRAMAWSDAILGQLEGGVVEPVPAGAEIAAKLAILRHPTTLEKIPDLRREVRVDRALIVANHAAVQADGRVEYDVPAIDRLVRERLGVVPTWAPIGPVVRQSLSQFSSEIELAAADWLNVFSQTAEPTPRTGFAIDRPRIGRHSRPQAPKWPATAKDVRRAYPTGDKFDVRILGGVRPATELLGGTPSSWTVYPFGSRDPMVYLQEIDFWVYFHHPSMREAYGRAIMEALWSGAVVVLPVYLEPTYGDAAVYGEPEDVRPIIESFQRGERDFLVQSARAQSFAREHSPELHTARVRELLSRPTAAARAGANIELPTSSDLLHVQPVSLTTTYSPKTSRFDRDDRPRALFVTSNGAGMGHLTRMLGIARASSHVVDPVFFSMSQGVAAVASAGFPYEYVPFTSALGTSAGRWHRYFHDRLDAAIRHYGAEVVLFDGTWPYAGMLSALELHDVMKVWVRRGMWKSNIGPDQLSKAARFDLVIEPGEFASTYDTGATTKVRGASVVPPITILSESEVLSRSAARAELGLADDGDKRYALVTLGAGNINDVSSTQERFLKAIEKRRGWEAVLTKAPIASSSTSAAVKTLSTFPLARYTRAFDFAVSAAGYNSFAEWSAGALPTIWIPNLHTMTDDQDARTRWAADLGYGLRVATDDPLEIDAAIERMCSDEWRHNVAARLSELGSADGARHAASLLETAWDEHLARRGGSR